MTGSSQLSSSLLCSSHPQLVKRIVNSRVYKTYGARFVKKKSACEERSLFLELGGSRSSTSSLHHPGAGGVTAHQPRQLVTVLEMFQVGKDGEPNRAYQNECFLCPARQRAGADARP